MRAKLNELRAKPARRARQTAKPSPAEARRRIQEGIEDVRQGRIDGPYSDADSFLRALHAVVRELPVSSKR